jgi:hypothetical protein
MIRPLFCAACLGLAVVTSVTAQTNVRTAPPPPNTNAPAPLPVGTSVDTGSIIPKGLKYNEQALYEESQEVLQGLFGSGAADEANDAVALPAGGVAFVGRFGLVADLPTGVERFTIDGVSQPGAAYVAFLDPTLRKLSIAQLPATIQTAKRIRRDSTGHLIIGAQDHLQEEGAMGTITILKLTPDGRKLVWSRSLAQGALADIALMADDTVLVLPASTPFVTRIKADGSGTIPFGQGDLRLDMGNPQVQQKYWVDLQYAAKGYGLKRIRYYGIGATHDGGVVVTGDISVTAPGGLPDFEPYLIKFGSDGNVLWATHLCQSLPALSDHKEPTLHVDPNTGDILIAMRQHGHFESNLIAPEGGMICNRQLNSGWNSGDLMIGWIGRVDAATGAVKNGTFYFSVLEGQEKGGKKQANTLLPRHITTDSSGYVYLSGVTAYKLATTKRAFQLEPLGGSTGFLTVFDPKLSRIMYANLFASGPNTGMSPNAVAIGKLGPVVVGSATCTVPLTAPFFTANIEKTNYLQAKPKDRQDVFITVLPSKYWFF